jgi:diaminohydroxyphosphoribosylaminopyrimidine deaminase/5-amino-6-(5-phosphoribosylamino)uracil reductase
VTPVPPHRRPSWGTGGDAGSLRSPAGPLRGPDGSFEADVTRESVDEAAELRHAAEQAMRLGHSVAGRTAPNPAVGCVIVADGRIIGEGATRPAGEAHAEVLALRDAGESARGATVVVTLEPCAHVGRTPACTAALIAAGVGSVRYLVSDPHPLASGGARVLRAAGIDARPVLSTAPELADLVIRAEHDLRGFLTLARIGRPHVLLKVAQTRDGRMSAPGSEERYLTGAAARHRVHELRADVDAVLVGSGTVRADDPQLDARDVSVTRQPRPIVLATTADLPLDARLLGGRALVMVGEIAPESSVRALEATGAEVVALPTVSTGGLRRLDLATALRLLPEHGVLSVLAEPGPTLAQALLDADLVDLVELHVAASGPKDQVVSAIALPRDRFETTDLLAVGDDLVVMARRRDHQGQVQSSDAQAVA